MKNMYYVVSKLIYNEDRAMKSRFLIILSIFCICQSIAFVDSLWSQSTWFQDASQNQRPAGNLFFYKLYTRPTASADTVQLTLYTKIAYDLLQFVLKDTIYEAQYELTVIIRNNQGESLPGRINRREIKVTNFAATNARDQFSKERFDFDLSTGEYGLFIELLDIETKLPIRHEETIILKDFFTKPLVVTEMLFFSESAEQANDFPDFPTVYSSADTAFLAKFYICSDGSLDDVALTKSILSNEGQTISESTHYISLKSRIQPIILPINQKFNFGEYTLSVTLTAGDLESFIESSFYIRWKSHSTLLPNLKRTVETIRYIMDSSLWDELQKQSPEKQKEILDQFWKERDPDPKTEQNELEEEYYRRVAFANQNLSTWEGGLDGWRTNRGKIYIIYGPPSEVETPSTSTGGSSRYEIWYYRNLQKRFVFLDRHGNGDYRLISEE